MAKYDEYDFDVRHQRSPLSNSLTDLDDFDAQHQRSPLPNPLADLMDLSRTTYSEVLDDDDWGFNEYEFTPRRGIAVEKIPDMTPTKGVPDFFNEGGVFNQIQAMLNKHKKDKATAEVIDALPSPEDIPVQRGNIGDLARRAKQKADFRNKAGRKDNFPLQRTRGLTLPLLKTQTEQEILAQDRQTNRELKANTKIKNNKSFSVVIGSILPNITNNSLSWPSIISGAGAAEYTPKKVTPKIKAATTKAFSDSAAQTNISKTQERLKSRFNINLPPEKLKEFANQVANAETGVYENPTQMLSADPKSSAVGKWQFVNDSRRTAAQGILNRNPNAPDWVKKAAKPMTDKAHTKFMQGLNESQQQDLFYARLAETKGSDALMAAWVKSGYNPKTAAEMYEKIHWAGGRPSASMRRHFIASNKKRYT